MISLRSCSRPVPTSVMSTFLRQAFLPLREGCLVGIVALVGENVLEEEGKSGAMIGSFFFFIFLRL